MALSKCPPRYLHVQFVSALQQASRKIRVQVEITRSGAATSRTVQCVTDIRVLSGNEATPPGYSKIETTVCLYSTYTFDINNMVCIQLVKNIIKTARRQVGGKDGNVNKGMFGKPTYFCE